MPGVRALMENPKSRNAETLKTVPRWGFGLELPHQRERATDGTRTRDVLDHNQVLCQLSYDRHLAPKSEADWAHQYISGRAAAYSNGAT